MLLLTEQASMFSELRADERGGSAAGSGRQRAGGGGGMWAGKHRTGAVASEAEIGFLLSSARQSPPLSCPSK